MRAVLSTIFSKILGWTLGTVLLPILSNLCMTFA